MKFAFEATWILYCHSFLHETGIKPVEDFQEAIRSVKLFYVFVCIVNGSRKVARGTHHVARWSCDGWSGELQRADDRRRRKSCLRGAPSFSPAARRTALLPATFPGSSWRCRFAPRRALFLFKILREIETLRSDRRFPSPAAEDEEVESPFSCLNPPLFLLLPAAGGNLQSTKYKK